MPTRSARSRRPAIFSIRPSQNACTTTSMRRVARSIRKLPTSLSADARPNPMRCCDGGVCWKRRRPPDVNIVLRRLLEVLLFAGVVFSAGAAQAHPHVWITATSELLYGPDGSMTGVRHAWTFDDMFATYALQGIET